MSGKSTRKLKVFSILAGCFLFTVGAYNACSSEYRVINQETVVGNPMAPNANKILYAVCGVVTRCNSGLAVSDCSSGVLKTSGIATRVGLSEALFPQFSKIVEAESQGTVIGSSSSSDTCYSQINNLPCTDPQVQGAYNPTGTDPYSGVAAIIPASSCGASFVEATKYVCSHKVFLRGTANPSLVPASSGTGLTYSISPALPAGLNLNSSTGIISGTPTAISAMRAYTITAINAMNSTVQSTVNLQTADGFLVNDLGDSDDNAIGDGNCRTSSGKCTLRAAVNEATAGPVGKVINVPAGTITLTSGQPLDVETGMDIYGDCAGGTILDGNNTTQLFIVQAGPTIVSDLTLQHGTVVASSNDSGGAMFINNGSGFNIPIIYVTLQNLVVQDNTVTGPTSGGGGGLFIAGWGGNLDFTIRHCLIQNNSGSGVHEGGGISLFTRSQGRIVDSIIRGNTSQHLGGGLMNSANFLTITNTLFENNTAAGFGGGAIYINIPAQSPFTVTNSTFYGNTADYGGVVNQSGDAVATFVNNTFAFNRATGTGNGAVFDGSGTGAMNLVNNIFLNNRDGAGVLKNCTGSFPINSQGNNLSDSNSADCGLTSIGDVTGTTVLLGPLQNNGGVNSTLALLPGSPGIGQGQLSSCPVTDQRGFSRLTNGQCDIGAFEVQP